MGAMAAVAAFSLIAQLGQQQAQNRAARHERNALTALLAKPDETPLPGADDAAKASASAKMTAKKRKGFQSTVLTDPLGGAGSPLTTSPVLG